MNNISTVSVCFDIPEKLYNDFCKLVEADPSLSFDIAGRRAIAALVYPNDTDHPDQENGDLVRGGRGEIKIRKGKREITVEVGSLWSTPEGDLFMHYKHPAEDNQGNQFVISQTVTGLAIVEHIRHSSVGKLLLRLLSQYGCWSNDPKTWHESQLSLVKSLRRDTRLWADLTEDETLTRVKEFFAGHGVTA